jgi:hypothetical protein
MSPMATSVTIHCEREIRIVRLEDRYRNELMGVEERDELRSRIVRLKRDADTLDAQAYGLERSDV